MSISPSDSELKDTLVALKAANPTLGIAKIHALLRSEHPDWAVSDKRTRKIMQNEGLVAGPSAGITFPSFRIAKTLDATKLSSKVEIHYFDKRKGKGLRLVEKVSEGEVLWKEDPFTLASDWDIFDLQQKSAACNYCSTPFHSDHTMTMTCPSTSTSTFCPARFCNRLCLSRSAKVHPLLCPAQNPNSTPIITFSRKAQWKALHALSQCASRLLLAYQIGGEAFEKDWDIFQGFASLRMEERFKNLSVEPDLKSWKNAHKLFVQAFQNTNSKSVARILKKPLDSEIEKALFDYESFSTNLGRMSLNLESHGGLYPLHSHMNHSCTPNISVRHKDQRTALSKITILALRDIDPGEELLITYVDPSMDVKQREKNLGEWGFGACDCKRCIEERKTYKPPPVDAEMPAVHEDLENELKASLGVF